MLSQSVLGFDFLFGVVANMDYCYYSPDCWSVLAQSCFLLSVADIHLFPRNSSLLVPDYSLLMMRQGVE
jgi:hypothetical protein